jgi:NADP-dependent 3-hydroxy acid dehydrogenase YdfG
MQTGLPVTLSMRRFGFADQQTFGRLSGDVNPIHVDPVASRRSVVGAIVVHGIHTLLWILDVLAKSEYKPAGIHLIDVRFPKAVYLDEVVKLALLRNTPDEMTLEATIGDRVVASVRLSCLPSSSSGSEEGGSGGPEALVAGGEPEDLAFETLRGKTGIVAFAMPAQEFADAFPDAATLVGAARLRGIAACSRLVGMDCPGLRSIFSRLSVTFTTDEAAPNLSYEVVKADARFRLVRMQIAGAGLQGQIESFSPPAPPQQLAMAEIAATVGHDEFAGQTALVVGGSRGLGELTAKAIAAGGGRVFLTYAIGKADADRVAGEIRASGGRADGFAYDVTKAACGQLAQLGRTVPTHIYYFATCKIFRSKTEAFEAVVLDEFMAFYVRGFYDLCRSLWDHEAKQLSVFYPSSVAVEERPRDLTEYAMAKAAGEVLCADLPRIMPGIRVLVKRLPRLLTDQTTSVASQDLPRSIDTILPIVREMK